MSAKPVEMVITFLTLLFLTSGMKAVMVFTTPTTLVANVS